MGVVPAINPNQLGSLVLLGCAAYLLYAMAQRFLDYQVSFPDTMVFSLVYMNQADTRFGREHDCRLPPELPKWWPLNIDTIKELWASNADGRLLVFICSMAKDYESRNKLC
jgi:hypothetical protein